MIFDRIGANAIARDFPFGVIGIEIQGMTAAAVLIHRDREHARATGFNLVTIGADQDAPVVRRCQPFCIEMNAVIELQPRTIDQAGVIERDSLHRPFGSVVAR